MIRITGTLDRFYFPGKKSKILEEIMEFAEAKGDKAGRHLWVI